MSDGDQKSGIRCDSKASGCPFNTCFVLTIPDVEGMLIELSLVPNPSVKSALEGALNVNRRWKTRLHSSGLAGNRL